MVLDRPGDEDDALAQQPRIDVEAAFAPVGLFDDDGDELRNDVLMVGHVNAIPWFAGGSLHRAERRQVQAGQKKRAAHCWTALSPRPGVRDQYFTPRRA